MHQNFICKQEYLSEHYVCDKEPRERATVSLILEGHEHQYLRIKHGYKERVGYPLQP